MVRDDQIFHKGGSKEYEARFKEISFESPLPLSALFRAKNPNVSITQSKHPKRRWFFRPSS